MYIRGEIEPTPYLGKRAKLALACCALLLGSLALALGPWAAPAHASCGPIGESLEVASRPAITGKVQQGHILTEHHARWVLSCGANASPYITSYYYDWQRCGTGAGAHCTLIYKGVSQSYKVTAQDVGHRIAVAEPETTSNWVVQRSRSAPRLWSRCRGRSSPRPGSRAVWPRGRR